MPANLNLLRDRLRGFDFRRLFIEGLGWSPPASRRAVTFVAGESTFRWTEIAQLSGVGVFEVDSGGPIPDARTRALAHREIEGQRLENVVIFVDKTRTQSLWYWVKRDGAKRVPREHLYFQGQPGDLFISKIGQMCFDLSEFDEDGNIPIVEVAQRIHAALDVEPVTRKFYREYDEQRLEFIELIQGVPNEQQRRWYASVLLNRLMFIYFLQKKGFVDKGNLNYLRVKLEDSKAEGKDRYFTGFLKLLFFDGFAKPERDRSPETNALLGDIKYLNGGLFLPHVVEQQCPDLRVPDRAFENLLGLFERYSWNLNDTPGGDDDEINPDVLGYIFEKYINQKAFGAYYTRPEITEYLCERTIHRLILDAVDKVHPGRFADMGELLMNLDAPLCKRLLLDVLPKLSLLDPACGSGAFLVAAMKVLIDIYSAIFGRIPFLKSGELKLELEKIQRDHKSIHYYIKKRIITDNLFGVDIMEEATEIARLRLFLALVSAADSVDQLEPLPNIDFNILPGNSLIGLLHVDPAKFDEKTGAPAVPGRQERMKLVTVGGKDDLPGVTFENGGGLTDKEREAEYLRSVRSRKFTQILEEKNRLIDVYRHAVSYGKDLTALRDNITAQKMAAYATLNKLLLDEFKHHAIKYEQATWDTAGNKQGKPAKRDLTLADIRDLHPFHWGFEFDEILNKRGGFDAVITNPPWEILKPNAKEFFQQYSDLITKKKMTIHDFEKQQAKLLKDPEIKQAWETYLSEYPHQSAYFRNAEQYRNQISIVNGKKAGTDINLYKLFTEQCYNLLRPGGLCGIVIPSGIYTDLGAKQLREMLFSKTRITGLFGFENRKEIFEGVHRSFKFVVLTFQKTRGTGFQPVDPSQTDDTQPAHHGQDAHATQSGTGFQPVGDHVQDAYGQDVHGPDVHGQDAHATISKRQGAYLPHWTRDHAIYSVTFRLADSLPRAVVENWAAERENIIATARQMNRPLSKAEEQRLQHLFSEKVEKYLDAAHGECWMKNDRIAEIVAGALKHFDAERYRLWAWCVMPNHVHAVVQPLPGHELPYILHSWKSFSANQANKALNRKGPFWQPEYYDHLIRDEKDLNHAIEYVMANPDKAGLKNWKWVASGTGFQPVIQGSGSGFQPVVPSQTDDTQPAYHGQDAHATRSGTGFQPVGDHVQDAHATVTFPAAFMRHDVAELEHFPRQGAIPISVELVRRLSPDSLSIMEFKNELDIHIAEKMLRFPLLGEQIDETWNVRFTAEFHMTNDSYLFKTEPGPGRLPLYEGKMIWHFDHRLAEPRYWVDEHDGRKSVLGRYSDDGQSMNYQQYRMGYRDVASSTNERSAISTIIPKNVFAGNTLPVTMTDNADVLKSSQLVAVSAVFNSYVFDAFIRPRITSHLNMFYVYQMPVPRLTESDPAFAPIVERAARLICTTPEFDDLAKEVGLGSHKAGATDPAERARLRADLDGLVAHLYGLTEDEFAHILTTFPLVDPGVKEAALEAYRALAHPRLSRQ